MDAKRLEMDMSCNTLEAMAVGTAVEAFGTG